MQAVRETAAEARAHRDTTEQTIADIARFLQDNFSQRVTAHVAGIEDAKQVGKWCRALNAPRHAAEVRLRTAYRIGRPRPPLGRLGPHRPTAAPTGRIRHSAGRIRPLTGPVHRARCPHRRKGQRSLPPSRVLAACPSPPRGGEAGRWRVIDRL